MKRTLICILVLAFPGYLAAQSHSHEEGTIVRMRMTDCMGPQHGFISVMSGDRTVEAGMQCPEYVLVGERVVYVISGRTSDQLIPLAEVTRFRIQKNELLIRIDDASKESRFHIKAMVLRPEWDRNQMLAEEEANATVAHRLDPAVVRGQQP